MTPFLIGLILATSVTGDKDLFGSFEDNSTVMRGYIHESTHGPNHATAKTNSKAPTVRVETVAGCYQLEQPSTACQTQREAIETQCPNDFIPTHYTSYTYSLATDEQLSSQYHPGYCPNTPQAPPIVVTQADFQKLPLTPSPLNLQPESGNYYVNLPVFVHTSSETQTHTTTLFNTPVHIRATPTTFEFTYGDGDTRSTTNPGLPYPDSTNAHTYTQPGSFTITVTTTWTGEFSTDNTSWQAIDGTATTTSNTQPLNITESIPLLTK